MTLLKGRFSISWALVGPGTLADPAFGLIHRGDGRWFDPALGRPLQPRPTTAPPTLPQALNPYGATPVGPPGVAEGISSHSLAFLNSPTAWLGLTANLAIGQAGETTVLSGRLVVEGSLDALQEAFQFGTDESILSSYSLIPVVDRPGIFRLRTRGQPGVIDELAGGGALVFRRSGQTVSTGGLNVVDYQPGLLLRNSRLGKALVSAGATTIIDVGYELVAGLTGTGRWGNPYWSPQQKIAQTILEVGSDVVLAAGLAFVNPYVAIPVAFIWAIGADDFFAVFPLTAPFYDERRNLQPLNSSG